MTSKKDLVEPPNPSIIKNGLGLMRMNFLLQAATLLREKSPVVSSFYIKEMVQIGEKQVIKV
jgi:hypothetical protein